MNAIQLSTRLRTVADLVPFQSIVADIGSDHAYLPVYLIQQNKCLRAIAGEVVQGPFESAVATTEEYHLTDRINVRLGNGLSVISPQDNVSVVTICGMGGELIATILDEGTMNGNLTGEEYLILQPNVAEHLVRKWLVTHHYSIVSETIVEDQHRLYEIITAKKSSSPVSYSDVQIEYGVFLTNERPPLALVKWQSLLEKYQFIERQIQQSKTPQPNKLMNIQKKIKQLKELVS